MKKIYLTLLSCFIAIVTMAQTPGFSYQAVILNPDALSLPGNNVEQGLLSESDIAIRFTIENDGGTEYQETHTTKTDAYGMVSLMVGQGKATIGNFTDIAWVGAEKYLKVEIDFTASGASYESLDRQALTYLPQPLSLESNNRINELALAINTVAADLTTIELTPGPQGNDGADGEVGASGADGAQGPIGPAGAQGADGATGLTGANGADGQGGVTTAGTGISVTGAGTSASPYVVSTTPSAVTYSIGDTAQGGIVFYVSPDGKNGLVAATVDQSTSSTWYNASDVISSPLNHTSEGQKFLDWRLPTKYELNQMYLNIGQGNALGLGNLGGFADDFYWSSTEDGDYAWGQNFVNGPQGIHGKVYNFDDDRVRAVRAF